MVYTQPWRTGMKKKKREGKRKADGEVKAILKETT